MLPPTVPTRTEPLVPYTTLFRSACVDIGERDRLVGLQVFAKILCRAKVAVQARDFAHHQARNMDTVGLGVLGVAADVPDVRIRERHALLAVRRIRQDFLISGHSRIANDFTPGLTVIADGNTLEKGTIGEAGPSRVVDGHT